VSQRIVVVGAGVVGVTCASRLSRDGHDVVLIEKNEEATADLTEKLDVQVIYGNGCSLSVLREAKIDQADLLLAVTDSDEVNMITALIAGSEFQVETKVVRLRSEEHLRNIRELSKSWPGKTYGINPGRLAANRITSLLDVPHASDVARLLDGRVVVAGFRVKPESPLVGKNMITLRHLFPGEQILVAAIYRKDEALLPRGETELMVGDTTYFSSIPEKIPEMVQLMGYTFDRDRMIVISGGGRIARMVARGALEREISTTILRRDRKRAELLAAEFPSAVVLQGDVTDESILREAGVESATSFIAATDDQETNLLSSVVAKRLGAGRVITLVDNPTYSSLVEALDIDADVSPRQAAVNDILRFVRGTHFQEVASLPGDEIEVAVVEVDEGSPLSGQPVRKLGLPRGVLITAVATADGVMIPHGDDVIPVGSRAVLFTMGKVAEKVAKFLEVRG
jgi:trk system potassium uptake protein TrkA